MTLDSGAFNPASMTWREAEHLAAEHMRALGFSDAEATPLGTDQGLDVIATGGVAQVKHFSSSPVGSPEVQRLKGAGYDHSRLLFYALNGYTSAARSFADSAGVVLFTYSLSRQVEPANDAAHELTQAGYVPKDFGTSTTVREHVLAELHEYGQSTIDSSTRLVYAINDLMSDPEWTSQLTEDRYFHEISPAVEDAVRLQTMFKDLTGTHPVGHIMSAIVEQEALAQKIAARFGLDYDDFLTGRSGDDPDLAASK